jgi:hypothetical protein
LVVVVDQNFHWKPVGIGVAFAHPTRAATVSPRREILRTDRHLLHVKSQWSLLEWTAAIFCNLLRALFWTL